MLWRDRVLLNKWAVTDHKFERGEVVTLTYVATMILFFDHLKTLKQQNNTRSPTNPKCTITKRIIALEGDTVIPLRNRDNPGTVQWCLE